MVILGVDPGYCTGLAVVEADGPELVSSSTVRGGRAACDRIRDVVMEFAGYMPEPRVAAVQTPMAAGKTARWNRSEVSLLKNASLSAWIAGYLEGLGFTVHTVPAQGGPKLKPSAEVFSATFGTRKRVSEHVRDAAMLACHIAGKLELERSVS